MNVALQLSENHRNRSTLPLRSRVDTLRCQTNTKAIGARIKELREKHSLSQSEFGAPLFMHFHTVSDLELGRRDPYASELLAIANQYQCSLLYLFYGL